MTDADAESPVNRIPLNLRIDKSVKQTYEEAIRQEYGGKAPYCGTELEREFRFRIDDSRSNDIWSNVTALADEFGQVGRKEKISRIDRGETTVVRYDIAEDVRSEIMKMADETDYRSPGAFVESIMHAYATGRSIEERLADRTDRILQAARVELDNSLSVVERRTKAIAEVLTSDGGSGFHMEDFENAIKAAKGIDSTRYVFEKYLPRVLDELGFTWHPNNENLFVEKDSVETEHRDPRAKPYILMDDEDRRDAFRYAVFEKDLNSSGKQTTTLSLAEAPGVLGASPQKKTILSDIQTIAKGDEGFKYVSRDDDRLAVDRQAIEPHTREELRAIARSQGVIQTDEPAESEPPQPKTAVDEPATSWVDDVLESVNIPDEELKELPAGEVNNLYTGKIAIKKYAKPGEQPSGDRLSELRAKVTDDDLDAVCGELGLPNVADASREEIEDEVAEEFAALEAASRARADGGRVIK